MIPKIPKVQEHELHDPTRPYEDVEEGEDKGNPCYTPPIAPKRLIPKFDDPVDATQMGRDKSEEY